MAPDKTHRTIEAVWRMESAKINGAVARMVRDLGLAEELAQDALVAALEHWPRSGVPDNPAAWRRWSEPRRWGGSLGPYALQAAIAACHSRARQPQHTDWPRIAALYDALAQLAPSPVVELNRAMAMAFGPAAGLELVDALVDLPDHLLPSSVRADLLAKLGRVDEACAEWTRAAGLTRNARERALLLGRAAECAQVAGGEGDEESWGGPAVPHQQMWLCHFAGSPRGTAGLGRPWGAHE